MQNHLFVGGEIGVRVNGSRQDAVVPGGADGCRWHILTNLVEQIGVDRIGREAAAEAVTAVVRDAGQLVVDAAVGGAVFAERVDRLAGKSPLF